MLEISFWVILFAKPVFWFIFPGDYLLGTALWVGCLVVCAFLYLLSTRFLIFYSPNFIAFAIFAYLIWTFFCSLALPWTENKVNAFSYALLPFLGIALVPRTDHLISSIERFCIGAIVSAAFFVSIVLVKLDIGDLSSRSTGLIGAGPNTIGFIAAVGVITALYLIMSSKSLFLRILIGSLGCFFCFIIFWSFSKTTILGITIALIFSQFASLLNFNPTPMKSGMKKIIAIISIIAIIAIFWLIVILAEDNLEAYFMYENSLETLSGRTILWEEIFKKMTFVTLMLGEGFNSSRLVSQAAGLVGFGTKSFTQAHNTFIEAIINTGVIGLMLLSVAFWRALYVMYRSLPLTQNKDLRNISNLLLQILVLIFFRGLSEGSYAQPGTIENILLFYLLLIAGRVSTSCPKCGVSI